jgi:LuxR family maltose regulon positive regulatory protein
VEALESRTEGWAAALQLAAVSLRGRDDATAFISSFAGDDRYVVDYLVDEVLDQQPPHLRRFLLDTSVLDRLCGPLCDAVTGPADGMPGSAVLETFERRNLLLVPWTTTATGTATTTCSRTCCRPGCSPNARRRRWPARASE